jgi:hypothetical protein
MDFGGPGITLAWLRDRFPQSIGEVSRMRLDDGDRTGSGIAPELEVVHRRWLLSKRADDGRPLLVREDRVVHPSGFGPRERRTTAAQAADSTSGTPALI